MLLSGLMAIRVWPGGESRDADTYTYLLPPPTEQLEKMDAKRCARGGHARAGNDFLCGTPIVMESWRREQAAIDARMPESSWIRSTRRSRQIMKPVRKRRFRCEAHAGR